MQMYNNACDIALYMCYSDTIIVKDRKGNNLAEAVYLENKDGNLCDFRGWDYLVRYM